ncbi:MAG: DinB family protein [Anaerolineae bacterium]|nr:DinB family protein [Anaerolineae bacterium]
MNLDDCIAQLEHNARTIQQLTANITAEQAIWQPDPDSWSAAAVMDHLYHEERNDFRARLAAGLGLPDPGVSQPDPPYVQTDLPAITRAFLAERGQSLVWLRGLGEPDWNVMCTVPNGSQISAGDMMASWVAHDILHMRQFVELVYAYTVHRLHPAQVYYAGEW